MGLCLGKSISAHRGSPDLPPEIAGLILCHLTSRDDWLSFAAVCRNWALAVQHHRAQLPPAVPCINLGDGAYLSLIDSTVRRFARPSGSRVEASFGSWLLYEHEPSHRCFLHGPFARDITAIEVPCLYGRTNRAFNLTERRPNGGYDVVGTCNPPGEAPCYVEKIVVESHQLVVAIFHGAPFNAAPAVNFACFRPGPGTSSLSWSHAAVTSGDRHQFQDLVYMDITFHRGKIFAVGWNGDLFIHEFLGGENRVKHVIVTQPPYAPYVKYHLLASPDKQKLLMVRWSIPGRVYGAGIDHHQMNLQVFEADLDRGQWSEVNDIGRQVLFVGTTGSRALAVAPASSEHYHWRFGGGNRVFLLGDDWAWAWARRHFRCSSSVCQNLINAIPTYCVYYMASGKTSLISLGERRTFSSMKSSRSEWFFPSG